jgi:hypothetical protein
MKLAKVWIVRDPGPHSALVDIVFEINQRGLGNYVLGCPPGAWMREQHTLFTEKNEAVEEGVRRLVRMRAEREGQINDEAYRVFGYGARKES